MNFSFLNYVEEIKILQKINNTNLDDAFKNFVISIIGSKENFFNAKEILTTLDFSSIEKEWSNLNNEEHLQTIEEWYKFIEEEI